jgi:hypothetical protein
VGPLALIAAVLTLMATMPASAQPKVAIFSSGGGSNTMTDFLVSGGIPGVTAAFVTEADLATAGFLDANGFTNLLISRNGASFGGGLTDPAAVANVKAWVNPDNVTLFLFDLADSFGLDNAEAPAPNANAVTLLTNAINFQSVAPRGYIGEFNGAATALTDGLATFETYLDFVPGTVTGFPGIGGIPPFTVTQPGNPITLGLPDGFDLNSVSPFPILSTGVPAANVFATWTNPADGMVYPVIESSIPPDLFPNPVVPEPGVTAMLAGMGLAGLLLLRRRTR